MRAEYRSSVIKPEMSRTYCTMSPVLNLTLSPRPKSRECLLPSIFLNSKKAPDNFAPIVATNMTPISNGYRKTEAKDMLAPTLRKNMGDKTMYPKKLTTFSSL